MIKYIVIHLNHERRVAGSSEKKREKEKKCDLGNNKQLLFNSEAIKINAKVT